MTDYFALLSLPRRPAVDAAALQENYLRLAAAWHPDSPGGDVEKFRELQEARKILSDPASRLRHLLALEGCEGNAGGVHGAPELFLEVAAALEAAKGLRGKVGDARSAIGRAALLPERHRVEQLLRRVAAEVSDRQETLASLLAQEDEKWPAVDFSNLERIGKNLVFLTRWSNELRDSLFQSQNSASS